MIKQKCEKVYAESVSNVSEDAIRIDSGSFIIDNSWVSFSGTIIKIKDYIKSIVVGSRTRFFKDRGYAVYLLICLDPNNGIVILEGKHVQYTTIQAVPPPDKFTYIPLIGLVMIQDGTRDLVYGFKPIKNEYLINFSGFGNILDKNIEGIAGEDCYISGDTGIQGETGGYGFSGITGSQGIKGDGGPYVNNIYGETGLQGMTGINWDVYYPFDVVS